MKQKITEAGFVNVVEQVYKTPLGGWPADAKLRELGQWALLGFDTGLEGYALATLTRVLGVSDPEPHTFLRQHTDDSTVDTDSSSRFPVSVNIDVPGPRENITNSILVHNYEWLPETEERIRTTR